MSLALVPVKALAEAKSRLWPELAAAEREALTAAMLRDVLDALASTPEVARSVVVTPDPRVAEVARAAGAEAWLGAPPGLNPALAAAARALARGDEPVLVVLGDVAGARAADLSALYAALAALGGRGVVIAPSADGGTSALLRAPAGAIPPCFGPESAKAHRLAAERAGAPCRVLSLASLALDLDGAEAVRAFLARPDGGAHTRAALARASRSGGVRLVPLGGVPLVRPGDDLAGLLRAAAARAGIALRDGVLVVCQKVVSKAEGRVIALADVVPSERARALAAASGKDPRHVEVVLRETVRVVREGHGVLICETRHGFVCANAGVDLSNAPGADVAVLLPEDPDASARRLRDALRPEPGAPLGVVVSDTFGRPWREGLVDVALGCAGIAPILDQTGRPDLVGRELMVTATATADQLAAAAGLLMRKDAGVPAVWVEGVAVEGDGRVRDTLRDPAQDLFR